MIKITTQQLNELLISTEKYLVLVLGVEDAVTDQLVGEIDDAGFSSDNVEVAFLNTDENPALVTKWELKTIPQIVLFENQKSSYFVTTEELKQKLKQYIVKPQTNG